MLRTPLSMVAGLFVVSSAAASDPRGSVGPGEGIVARGEEPTGCGTLVMNADVTYENGYNWQYGGVSRPYYGAMAECYDGPVSVCSIILDATGIGIPEDSFADLYVWRDDDALPGEVVALVPHVLVGPFPLWPSVARYVFDVPDVECLDRAWVGYWPEHPGRQAYWFIGADLDGPGGCAMTNIAPGIGYPTGWRDVSVTWGPTQALGIGAEVISCDPVPTTGSSWGRVKSLYR